MSDKKFAIEHMNRDHLLAIYDYANAFAGQDLNYEDRESLQLKLVDLSLDSLDLEWTEDGVIRTAKVPIDPPMANMNELRTRVTLMAFEAADKLGLAPFQLTTYKHWDNPIDAFVDLSMWGMALQVSSGTLLSSYFDCPITRFLDEWVLTVLLGCLALHILWIPIFTLPMLRKYRVTSPAYYKWIVAVTQSGVFALMRFKRVVKPREDHRRKFEQSLLTTNKSSAEEVVASTSGSQ